MEAMAEPAQSNILQLARGAAVAALLLALAACAGTATGHGQPATAQGSTCHLSPAPNTLLSLARCCAESLVSNPSCREYNPDRQFVIVKDNAPSKPDAYLIIPVAPVTGIEDKQVFHSPVADFWQYGWEEAGRFLRVPDRATALAINSVEGRSQNQLHIHISCVRPDVASALEGTRRLGHDPKQPMQLRLRPANHVYRAIVVRDLIRNASPFLLVAQMPGAAEAMGRQSLAVIGSRVPNTYYVVDTVAGPGNPGSAEELLDQTCSTAQKH